MRAVVNEKYGSPDVLRVTEVETPTPKDDQVLVEIHSVSINGSDREGLVGSPLYTRIGALRKPSDPILGSDIAGRVVAVGKDSDEFKVGDEVFGEMPSYHGGFAEYVCTRGKTLAIKPSGLTFDHAAAIPQAGVIALRAIRGKGNVQPGQKVLINGGGGSAGSFAIPLAKLAGAEVTGVDNAGKLDFMRSLGADQVIDHAKGNFTKAGERYDLIVDLIARRSVFACARALRPGGTYYFVGGRVRVILQILLFGGIIRKVTRKSVRMLVVPQSRQDLMAFTELCESGELTPIIDRRYTLEQVPEAMRYVVEGRAKGKVVIKVRSDGDVRDL